MSNQLVSARKTIHDKVWITIWSCCRDQVREFHYDDSMWITIYRTSVWTHINHIRSQIRNRINSDMEKYDID